MNEEESLQIAAQCWCDPETSMIEMYIRLAGAFAKRLRELNQRQDKVREALEFIVNREDFSFAECSVAEEIWGKARDALKKLEGL